MKLWQKIKNRKKLSFKTIAKRQECCTPYFIKRVKDEIKVLQDTL